MILTRNRRVLAISLILLAVLLAVIAVATRSPGLLHIAAAHKDGMIYWE